MNWFQIFEIAVEEAAAIEGDIVAIEADQPVASPPVFVTLEGHKYQAVLNLTPVPA